MRYTGLWLNDQGFERARATGRLHIRGTITHGASETFLKRNQNRTLAEQAASQRALVARYKELGIQIERGGMMAAFGCNFEGAIAPEVVRDCVGSLLELMQQQSRAQADAGKLVLTPASAKGPPSTLPASAPMKSRISSLVRPWATSSSRVGMSMP